MINRLLGLMYKHNGKDEKLYTWKIFTTQEKKKKKGQLTLNNS